MIIEQNFANILKERALIWLKANNHLQEIYKPINIRDFFTSGELKRIEAYKKRIKIDTVEGQKKVIIDAKNKKFEALGVLFLHSGGMIVKMFKQYYNKEKRIKTHDGTRGGGRQDAFAEWLSIAYEILVNGDQGSSNPRNLTKKQKELLSKEDQLAVEYSEKTYDKRNGPLDTINVSNVKSNVLGIFDYWYGRYLRMSARFYDRFDSASGATDIPSDDAFKIKTSDFDKSQFNDGVYRGDVDEHGAELGGNVTRGYEDPTADEAMRNLSAEEVNETVDKDFIQNFTDWANDQELWSGKKDTIGNCFIALLKHPDETRLSKVSDTVPTSRPTFEKRLNSGLDLLQDYDVTKAEMGKYLKDKKAIDSLIDILTDAKRKLQKIKR
jgi:hypothetical protein